MSKIESTSTLGYTINVSGTPASNEEYDQMANAIGAARDRAVDSDLQHDWKGRFRGNFCKALETLTGIARLTKKNDKNKEVFDELEKPFVLRVEAATGKKFGELAQTTADETPYKAQAMGGAVGKSWLNEADGIIAVIGDNSWDKFIENVTAVNPGFQFAMEEDAITPTRESVALALKVDESRQKAERAASRLALVG